jgi:phosphoglycolate phosphatase (TIGR01487 family)
LIKLILTDLDGTLTEDRGVYRVDLEAIEAIRRAQEAGIKVALVSGNSYPVLRGLYNYLGLNGGLVAENGCVVFYGKERLEVCKRLDKEILEEFRQRFKLKDSWQNEFRCCDFGFTPAVLNEEMLKWAEDRGVYVNSSGYAVHVAMKPAGKGVGVRKLIELHGVRRDEVAALGDSMTDLEMFQEVGLKVAVGNADEKLKENADVVLNLKSGKGVKEFISSLLDDGTWN